MSAAPGPVALVPHPDDTPGAIRRLAAYATRSADGSVAVSYELVGDLAALRIPAPAAPRIEHGLWHHTCFEIFLAVEGAEAYHELNFAPSGAWAAFAFRGYRDGAPLLDEALAPGVVVRRDADRLTLDAQVRVGRLSAAHATAPLRLALAAVVEDAGGARSFWALRHPAGRPDFHHADGFALRLET